jgi:2,4-dienoyl-CoA reductase-like NADH-dependent reductase (Old Yellow Enzyme family)
MSKSLLFSPLQIKNTVFKNRIVISSMCQYSAENGFANDWHLVHLGSRAVGGAALIMQEATSVSAEGRITYRDLGLWQKEQMQKLQQIVSFLHNNNAKVGIQLAHAGRKASCEVPWLGGHQFPPDHSNGWQTVGPSPIAFKEGQHSPVELDQQGINKVIDDFVAATKKALQIGYDVVEIHAAHGYLIHQFYSPLSNFRKDKYGGNFENRIRLLMEVTDAVQSVWGKERPLFVRISATDWTEGGWTIEDSIRLCTILKARGVDFIDVSSGGNALVKIPAEPGYQVQFAERIKKETGIYCGAVGLITKPQQAEAILEKQQADMIFIARESLRNPYFPLRASAALENSIDWPVQYQRAGNFE